MKCNLLIDAQNLAFRTFSTLDLWNENNENVSAIFGVLKNLHSFVVKFKPGRVILCWDERGSSDWRRQIYPDYKRGRYDKKDEEKMERMEDFFRQLEILRFTLADLPIHQIGTKEMEADDVMHVLTNRLLSEDHNIIISTDKDLLQLINENTAVFSPTKGYMITSEDHGYEYPDEIRIKDFEEEVGVPPKSFVDYKILVGDTSDNIKGVRGIGDKTAAKLLQENVSISNMIKRKEELSKSKRNAAIFEDLDQLEKLRNIMDISKVESQVPKCKEKVISATTDPRVNYKNFWNFAKDNGFKSIYMDYKIWSQPFKKMGVKHLPF